MGWAKQQLSEFAKSELKIQLSAKTIQRVERNTGYFARITFTRIVQVVNAARAKNPQLPPLMQQDLFPSLMQKRSPSPAQSLGATPPTDVRRKKKQRPA